MWEQSFQLLPKFIHLLSVMKWRTKWLSLWKQFKILLKILLFLSCIFGSCIMPITFSSIYFHSPVPIRVASLGKSHIVDLCSKTGEGREALQHWFLQWFLEGMKPYVWTTKVKINKWDDVNLKASAQQKKWLTK